MAKACHRGGGGEEGSLHAAGCVWPASPSAHDVAAAVQHCSCSLPQRPPTSCALLLPASSRPCSCPRCCQCLPCTRAAAAASKHLTPPCARHPPFLSPALLLPPAGPGGPPAAPGGRAWSWAPPASPSPCRGPAVRAEGGGKGRRGTGGQGRGGNRIRQERTTRTRRG
jgi:hypothetical protein